MKATTKDAHALMHSGSVTFAEIEANGIRIDVPYLNRTIEKTVLRIKKLASKIKDDPVYRTWFREFGQDTNLDSGPQLARILFDILKYPCHHRTETGKPATGKEVLAEIDHLFVKRLVKLKALKKLKATFLEGLRREVTSDGFLHPDLNLHMTKSYRSSSGGGDGDGSYNTQNIPSRDADDARTVRRAFIPRPGRVIIENDFSAHEFKIAANVWGDPVMRQYASDKSKDIHRDMAAKCFLMEPKQVDKMVRYVGKNGFVFPKLYGSIHKQIARNMWNEIGARKLMVGDVPMREHLVSNGIHELGRCHMQEDAVAGTFEYHIKQVEDQFAEQFHVFAENCEKAWQDYRNTGRFDMVTGFRIEGLYTRNALLNYKVQGPAFHCLLWTTIELQKELKRRKMKALLINEIHDCIDADVPVEEVQNYLYLVKEIVEERLPKAWTWLEVPLEIEAEVAEESWADKKTWIEQGGKWVPTVCKSCVVRYSSNSCVTVSRSKGRR